MNSSRNNQPASLPNALPADKDARRLIALVGATGTGKTELAVSLVERFGGIIISADSRQIYQGMSIGTAKPTAEQRRRVSHALIDVRTPAEGYSLAEYLREARAAIDAAHGGGRLPWLVGGTAQYVYGVLEGWEVPPVAPQWEMRARLEAEGAAALYHKLREVDPEAAERIGATNTRRLVRALEVWLMTGRTPTSWQAKHPLPYPVLRLGLRVRRDVLHARIAARVDRMLAAGLVDEVKRLLDAGYAADLPAFNSMGYAEMIRYLHGDVTLEEARQLIITSTHRYVRHQETWFRRDPHIHWVDAENPDAALVRLAAHVTSFLARNE